jgi:hypothetical protein
VFLVTDKDGGFDIDVSDTQAAGPRNGGLNHSELASEGEKLFGIGCSGKGPEPGASSSRKNYGINHGHLRSLSSRVFDMLGRLYGGVLFCFQCGPSRSGGAE